MSQTVSNAVILGSALGAPEAATIRWAVPAIQGSAHLTPRQLEVLALLCEGLPNKLICRRLNIATGTVKVHISSILRELGVASRLQAVVAARGRDLAAMIAAGTSEEGGASAASRQAEATAACARGGTGSSAIVLGI